MLSVSQIESAIENFSHRVPFSYINGLGKEVSGTTTFSGWEGFFDMLTRNGVELEGVGTAYRVDEVGGEGEGDYMHVVFEIIDKDGTARLFKKEGRWVSYDGAYWDEGDCDFYEVVPKEKTITVYERKTGR
jgi:hypothetical protein